MKLLLTLTLSCFFASLFGQRLTLVPRLGVHWHGISRVENIVAKPVDLRATVPKLAPTIGADIVYRRSKFAHILSVQTIALGPAFSIRNVFAGTAIMPSFLEVGGASSGDNLFIGYSLQKETVKYTNFLRRKFIRFHYGLGLGVAFNKSQEVYDANMASYCVSYGGPGIDSYANYCIRAWAKGHGVFVTPKAGFSFYNRKKKEFLNLQVFWMHGLRRMASFDLEYDYGYFSNPLAQRTITGVRLNSRGTVFGITAGVPIRLIK